MKITVSIILPVYNGASSIQKAIESVLRQSVEEFELIVVDDGSVDATESVVTSFSDNRIIFVRNDSNLGLQKSLNKGLRIARGKYIARIDADDVWIDTCKLALQVNFLDKNLAHVLVGTGAILVDSSDRELTRYLLPETDTAIRSRILGKNCFVHSSVMLRRDTVQGLGGYSEEKNVQHVEDHELWLRLGNNGKFANLPLYGVALTVSAGSVTVQHRVCQAQHMMRLAWTYRTAYPHVFRGLIIALARYLFFMVTSIIPLPKKILYKLQGAVRSH